MSQKQISHPPIYHVHAPIPSYSSPIHSVLTIFSCRPTTKQLYASGRTAAGQLYAGVRAWTATKRLYEGCRPRTAAERLYAGGRVAIGWGSVEYAYWYSYVTLLFAAFFSRPMCSILFPHPQITTSVIIYINR